MEAAGGAANGWGAGLYEAENGGANGGAPGGAGGNADAVREPPQVREEDWARVEVETGTWRNVLIKHPSREDRKVYYKETLDKLREHLGAGVDARAVRHRGTLQGPVSIKLTDAEARVMLDDMIIIDTDGDKVETEVIFVPERMSMPLSIVLQVAQGDAAIIARMQADNMGQDHPVIMPTTVVRTTLVENGYKYLNAGVPERHGFMGFTLNDGYTLTDVIEAVPENERHSLRTLYDDTGHFKGYEAKLPGVVPWVPLEVIDIRMTVRCAFFSPDFEDGDIADGGEAEKVLKAITGQTMALTPKKDLQYKGGLATVNCKAANVQEVRGAMHRVYEDMAERGIIGIELPADNGVVKRYRVMIMSDLTKLIEEAVGCGLASKAGPGGGGGG